MVDQRINTTDQNQSVVSSQTAKPLGLISIPDELLSLEEIKNYLILKGMKYQEVELVALKDQGGKTLQITAKGLVLPNGVTITEFSLKAYNGSQVRSVFGKLLELPSGASFAKLYINVKSPESNSQVEISGALSGKHPFSAEGQIKINDVGDALTEAVNADLKLNEFTKCRHVVFCTCRDYLDNSFA